MWLALRAALLRGEVKLLEPPVPNGTRFGVRIEVRAPARGPRSAPALSEALVDGALCALHAGSVTAAAADIAAALGSRLASVDAADLRRLVEERPAVFPGSPFQINGTRVQLSPCDEFCDAGEVRIVRDPTLSVVTTAGAVFTLSPGNAAGATGAAGGASR